MEWFLYISYVLVLLSLAGYGFHRLTIIYLYLKHKDDVPVAKGHFDELPVITMQLPVFNELHVAERLIQKVAEIDYPKDKLHIQVLDDSTDETQEICREQVADLVSRGFDAECIHRSDRTGYKAGALENGIKSAKGEYLFILDADFVPNADVLQKTIHYFTDDKVGMIQTRWGHLNRNYNVLTRIQAMFLDGHLELEQTARNRSGRFFTFNGTGGMWRKSCIADAGGWEHDTLTEDMDLSYRAQLKGWNFVFLKDVESPAELPVDMDGFKSQQHRWTKGSIQCCKKCLKNIWKSDAPLKAKMEATAHLTSNFAYLALIVLCFLIYPKQLTNIPLIAENPMLEYCINIPIFFFGSVSVALFYLTAQKALHPKTWLKEIIYLPLLIALGIGMSVNNAKAVLEALFNHESGFVRTPKYGIDKAGAGGEKQSVGWKSSKYKAMKSVTPLIEFAFGVFFLIVVISNYADANFATAILLTPFPIGFFFTSIPSLKRMFAGFVKNSVEESIDSGK
ncbi:MAG: cellulose synthase/poly-beta-1,6-N-acetylglucosamine synthase-like glycosyltransferase [Rubritalea sp.]|jgi:cellulose synthase/poly-beta-1,6-N-acetylglucosamine synthase-like glycosyltransferase|tara:strand:- start:6001 stop:7524 length:1524 start_codon:yes stop_codon:yes gene_type:complete